MCHFFLLDDRLALRVCVMKYIISDEADPGGGQKEGGSGHQLFPVHGA